MISKSSIIYPQTHNPFKLSAQANRAIKDHPEKMEFLDSSGVPDSRDPRENRETKVPREKLERKVMKVQLDLPLSVIKDPRENRVNR